jgi:hypothetical protein
MSGINKTKETAQAQQLLAGFLKHLSAMVSLMVESAVYTPAQITDALKAFVTLRSNVVAAQAAAKVALNAEEAQAPALLIVIDALVSYVKLTYAKSPDVLADFGLKPRKAPTPLTAEQKAAANAKRRATRAARGITTKAAKQAQTGNVVGVTITPVLAPAPTAPVVAPASPTAPPVPQTGGSSGGPTTHGS